MPYQTTVRRVIGRPEHEYGPDDEIAEIMAIVARYL
jgi:hypothetical protein